MFSYQISKNKPHPLNRASQMRRGVKEEKMTERSRTDQGDTGEEVFCVHAVVQRAHVDCTRFCCRFERHHISDHMSIEKCFTKFTRNHSALKKYKSQVQVLQVKKISQYPCSTVFIIKNTQAKGDKGEIYYKPLYRTLISLFM